MKYLCLICPDATVVDTSDSEAAQRTAQYIALAADLHASGHLVGGNRLQAIDTAVTVRVRAGKLAVTDGPWVETKEVLGGYFLIEAQDVNEAIRIAARIPAASHGCIEVRPVAESNAE